MKTKLSKKQLVALYCIDMSGSLYGISLRTARSPWRRFLIVGHGFDHRLSVNGTKALSERITELCKKCGMGTRYDLAGQLESKKCGCAHDRA